MSGWNFEQMARDMAKGSGKTILCLMHPDGAWDVYNPDVSAEMLAAIYPEKRAAQDCRARLSAVGEG